MLPKAGLTFIHRKYRFNPSILVSFVLDSSFSNWLPFGFTVA